MKNYSLLILFLTFASGTLAQNREVRDVRKFSSISFSIPGKLFLKQGSSQRVELEGDPQVLKDIKTTIDGDRLKIERERSNRSSRDDDKIVVYITATDIDGVYVSGSGDVIGQSKINADDVDLRVSGSGSLTLELDAEDDVDANVSGSGAMQLSGRFGSFDGNVSGSGKIGLSASIHESAELSVSGSGRFEASGRADKVKVSVSGSGKVAAADLQANACTVRISGSGNVEVHATKELDATISGSGAVSYRGNPAKVNAHSSGSGKVKRI